MSESSVPLPLAPDLVVAVAGAVLALFRSHVWPSACVGSLYVAAEVAKVL